MTQTAIMQRFIKNEHGEIEVPDNEDEKIELSRDLFGSTLIHSIDYWLDIAKDLLDNEVPTQSFERQNKAAKTDTLYRETFSKLDDRTKKIILQLIASTASGVVYSTLLDLDRYHFWRYGDFI